jgi:NADH-quinone oxidoreductase subunit L
VLAYYLYVEAKEVPGRIYMAILPLSKLSSEKFYIDEIYEAALLGPLRALAGVLLAVLDQRLIDGAVNSFASFIDAGGGALRGTQTGQVRHYALFMFMGAVLLLLFYMVL